MECIPNVNRINHTKTPHTPLPLNSEMLSNVANRFDVVTFFVRLYGVSIFVRDTTYDHTEPCEYYLYPDTSMPERNHTVSPLVVYYNNSTADMIMVTLQLLTPNDLPSPPMPSQL